MGRGVLEQGEGRWNPAGARSGIEANRFSPRAASFMKPEMILRCPDPGVVSGRADRGASLPGTADRAWRWRTLEKSDAQSASP